MKKLSNLQKTVLALAIAIPAAGAQATDFAPNEWQFSVAPYLWLPSVNGDLKYGPPANGGSSANVSVGADKLLDSLDMAMMISGSAHKDRWLVTTDLMYLDLSGNKNKVQSVDLNPGSGPINVSTSSLSAGVDVNFKGTIWTMAGGYAVIQEPKATLNLIGGFRYIGLKAKTDWQLSAAVTGTGPQGQTAVFSRSGSVEKSDNIWAGIVGAQGRYTFGESNWFTNYYVDVGAGSNVFTWQGAGGLGYAFKWGDVVFDYRYMYYSSDSDNKMIENLSFGGPALGLNFRF